MVNISFALEIEGLTCPNSLFNYFFFFFESKLAKCLSCKREEIFNAKLSLDSGVDWQAICLIRQNILREQ